MHFPPWRVVNYLFALNRLAFHCRNHDYTLSVISECPELRPSKELTFNIVFNLRGRPFSGQSFLDVIRFLFGLKRKEISPSFHYIYWQFTYKFKFLCVKQTMLCRVTADALLIFQLGKHLISNTSFWYKFCQKIMKIY